MTEPRLALEITPLSSLLNNLGNKPTEATNRAQYETLALLLNALNEFGATLQQSSEEQATGLAVLSPAVSLLSSVLATLADVVSIYPRGVAPRGSFSIRFSALIPRVEMTLMVGVAESVNEAMTRESGDRRSIFEAIANFVSELTDFNDNSIEKVVTEVESIRDDTDRYSVTVGPHLEERFKNRLWNQYKSYLVALESQQRTMASELHKLETIRKAAEKAATETGKRRLKRDFGSVGNRETIWATVWTVFAFVLTVAAIATPIVLFVKDVHLGSVKDTAAMFIKTFIGVPLLAFAAYCGKVASQHRDAARHLKLLVSQIDSIAAYVADLPDDSRDEIQLILGRRAFSDPESAKDDAKADLATGPGELTLVLSKALDVIEKLSKTTK